MKLVLLLALVPALAAAGPEISVTREPWRWSLVDDQNVPVKDVKGQPIKADTEEQCGIEAVKAFGLRALTELYYRCTTVVRLHLTGVCTGDNPEPPKPVDDDGFTVFPEDPEPEACPENMPNRYRLLSMQWVVEYPTCGEYQPVEIQACGYVVPEPPDSTWEEIAKGHELVGKAPVNPAPPACEPDDTACNP